jgi:hypothetical protein
MGSSKLFWSISLMFYFFFSSFEGDFILLPLFTLLGYAVLNSFLLIGFISKSISVSTFSKNKLKVYLPTHSIAANK